MKQRDQTYDLMKGIAILLMMASHLVLNYGLPKQIIYSFHMPLFFILAGFFAKDISAIPSFRQFTINNARRLLFPFVVTMLLISAWGTVQAYAKHNVGLVIRPMLSMLLANADDFESQWGVIYAGPMWFLVALFWVRELFYGIQRICARVPKYRDEWIVGICVALSIASVWVHPLLPPLPFSILQAFASLAFYAVGWYIHRHPMPWWVYGACMCVWPVAIWFGGVDLACCQVDYYPLSFIGAFGGTYAIYLLCKGLDKLSTFTRSFVHPLTGSLAWCGIYSLPLLCMHELEMYSSFIYSIQCRIPQVHYLIGWGEVVIAIIMTIIVIHIPFINKIYK